MDNELDKIRALDQLALTMDSSKDIVTREYLYNLEKYEVLKLPAEIEDISIIDYSRIFKFRRMVSDKKESVIEKLVTVLNAAYTSGSSVIALISGHQKYTDYYLGVVSKDISQESQNIETQGETLRGVLTGNFPGLEILPIKGTQKEQLMDNIFVYDYITSISGIASIRNEKESNYEKFVQGIENLVDSFQGREYSVVVIADPINAEELEIAKLGYESLHSQLSPFLKTSLSFNESESITVTQSQTDGVTESIGRSTSLTQNYSINSGWSNSSSHGTSSNKNIGGAVGSTLGAVIGTGAGIAATVFSGGTLVTAAPTLLMAGQSLGQAIGQGIGDLIGSQGENINASSSQTGGTSKSSGKTESENSSTAKQTSYSNSEAEGNTHGKTIQFTNENKSIKNLLGIIDKHVERLQKCESFGAFNCATYVISSDPETNAIVSNGYNALMRGDNSSLQASFINTWTATSENGMAIKKYLKNFSHPLFKNPINSHTPLTPASVVNSYELAINLGIPKKSISGLPVFEVASFGRNVFETNYSSESLSKINLGNIFHMGSDEKTTVDLDLKSLAMHTFITGSTGSGKSNTVYQLLRELKKNKVNFLVIEPAKGEYKHVFGTDEVAVYGTNPLLTPLLKINPFKFPDGIHVLEHIDRLIEIFNVCWPMYAAMPAVLKDSVERAYKNSGWDLSESINKYNDELFPTFFDVLNELNKVVEESAFSQEVKDNYIGSLSTRIKSLTNGMYGKLFDNNELGDHKIFDDNVIIDLSRIGSIETKSMIMGILIMRLQEYRMTSGIMNANLRHVTVLEEAHNLLKRTSTEQSSESSNLLGKSVEMLSNAIAEVRTYGEGFIIADQAPGLLDMSVIRNTNTKIIMRLPDAEDRNLVGKSANLSDEQIKELAKIPTGVAAIYQNNWLEPVLCKVNYEKTNEYYVKSPIITDGSNKVENNTILINLLNKLSGERFDLNMKELMNIIVKSSISTIAKAKAIKVLKTSGIVEFSDICSIVYDIVCTTETEKELEKATSIDEWKNILLYSNDAMIAELLDSQQNQIIECILREQIIRYEKPEEYLETWYKYISKEVM